MYSPLKMLTDSKQLFDVMDKSWLPTEKRLMMDVTSLRESYRPFEITDIRLILGTVNIADAFKKDDLIRHWISS